MTRLCRHRTPFVFIALLCILPIKVAQACTLCMDAKILYYFPGLDLLFPLFLIYIMGRMLSILFGDRKILWKQFIVISLCFFIIALNLGMLIAFTSITTYWILRHIHRFSRFKRPLNRVQKFEVGLLLILIVSLGGIYRIGKIRESDDEWLLKHLGMKASAELNYKRLTHLPQIKGLCATLKHRASLSYVHEISTGWLSRLALEKDRCKEDLTHLYLHKREKALSSVYIPLILMTDQDDHLWVDICKDQSFLDRPLHNKDWISRLDEAQSKLEHACNPL